MVKKQLYHLVLLVPVFCCVVLLYYGMTLMTYNRVTLNDQRPNYNNGEWMRNIDYTKCNMSAWFSSTGLPVMALVSYPGSGNTWLRHLLESATGITTGSVFCDPGVHFAGECTWFSNTTLTTKTHQAVVTSRAHKVVLLLRQPEEAILAHYKYFRTKNHTGQIANIPAIKEYRTDLQLRALCWARMNLRTLALYPGPLYPVLYHQLKSNLSSQLLNLLRFLDVPSPGNRFPCTIRNSEGHYHRKHNPIVPYQAAISEPQTRKLLDHVYVNVTRAVYIRIKDGFKLTNDNRQILARMYEDIEMRVTEQMSRNRHGEKFTIQPPFCAYSKDSPVGCGCCRHYDNCLCPDGKPGSHKNNKYF